MYVYIYIYAYIYIMILYTGALKRYQWKPQNQKFPSETLNLRGDQMLPSDFQEGKLQSMQGTMILGDSLWVACAGIGLDKAWTATS